MQGLGCDLVGDLRTRVDHGSERYQRCQDNVLDIGMTGGVRKRYVEECLTCAVGQIETGEAISMSDGRSRAD